MLDHRNLLKQVLVGIEDMAIVDQHKYLNLQLLIPELYKAIQIEDECDHKYRNGQCVCGKFEDKA